MALIAFTLAISTNAITISNKIKDADDEQADHTENPSEGDEWATLLKSDNKNVEQEDDLCEHSSYKFRC